jgi:hypothetical protein
MDSEQKLRILEQEEQIRMCKEEEELERTNNIQLAVHLEEEGKHIYFLFYF